MGLVSSNRFYWFVIATTSLVLAVIGHLTYYGFLETYRELDISYLHEDVRRIERTVDEQLQSVEEKVADWSTWDDTYEFINGRNPGFIAENINADSLGALGVEFVIFLDASGDLYYGVEFDDESKTIKNLTKVDVASVVSGSSIFADSGSDMTAGFARIGDKTVALASRYLTDNLARKPKLGRLILGDGVSTHLVRTVSDQMLREVFFVSVDDFVSDQTNESMSKVSKSFLWLTHDTGVGFFPLGYADGETLGYLKFLLPRSIIMHGRRSATVYAAVYFIGSLFLVLGLSVLLRMKVVERSINQLAIQNDSLERQNNFLQELVDSVPGYVSWFDDSLRYIGVNNHLAKTLGRKPSDFQGRRAGFLDANKPSIFTEQLTDFFASTEQSRQTEVFMDVFGDQKKILLNLVKFDGGRRLVVIGIDFTETYHLQQQAIRDQQRVVDSARLASLGEMAGGIAHEINSPLSIILAASEQLSELFSENESDRARELLSKISRTVTRISKIIRGLRAFARDGGSDLFSESSMVGILQDSLDLCRERFTSQNIDMILKIEEDALISCRSVQIGQVMINLLNNAYDAVLGLPDAWVAIETEFKDGHIHIYVDDSGHITDRDIVNRMMNPFFTTKPVGKGTGLGLSISRSIVEDHGGTFYYDEAHKNTRFVVTFPGKKIEKNQNQIEAA